MANCDDEGPINVGTGEDVTIAQLAESIAAVVGYEGRIEFDHVNPDGTPRKLLDVSRLSDSGWSAQISLADGLALAYEDFQAAEAAGSLRE